VGHVRTLFSNSYTVNVQEGTDSNIDIKKALHFLKQYKFHVSAHFKYRTTSVTYLFVTSFSHQEERLIQ